MTPGREGNPAVAVNAGIIGALIFGTMSWLAWPQSAEWWGLGVISILFGAGAAGCLINALKAVYGSWQQRKTLALFMAQGGPQKAARLADTEMLKRAGMIE